MEREFTYTKERIRVIVEDILERDIRDREELSRPERIEEAFEKRAVLEFLLWFLDEAFPENFSFRCRFSDLELDYGDELARQIAEGPGWMAEDAPREQAEGDDNVIFVDFRRDES
jgi:hypothetical protein